MLPTVSRFGHVAVRCQPVCDLVPASEETPGKPGPSTVNHGDKAGRGVGIGVPPLNRYPLDWISGEHGMDGDHAFRVSNQQPQAGLHDAQAAVNQRGPAGPVAGLRTWRTLRPMMASSQLCASTPRNIRSAMTRLSGSFREPAAMSALYRIPMATSSFSARAEDSRRRWPQSEHPSRHAASNGGSWSAGRFRRVLILHTSVPSPT